MDTFKAVTWNAAGGTNDPPSRVKINRMLQHQVKERDVSLFLLQEFTRDEAHIAFADSGLTVYAQDQYGIAFDSRWVGVQSQLVRLSDHPFYRPGKEKPIYVDALRAIICDRAGHSLEVLSYHTPPTVQRANPAPNRLEALRNAMVSLGEIAEESVASGFLCGGDDNVDEDMGYGPWDFMLAGATGLRQIQAPSPTFRARNIDDFRIVRGGALKVVGDGWVFDGGGDHKGHGRKFAWR